MNRLFQLLKKPWAIQLIGLLALGVLVWFAGPLIGFGGKVPFERVSSRLATIAAMLVGWVIWRLVAELRAARKDRQLMAGLAAPGAGKSDEQLAADENIEILGRNFQEALRVLRETRSARRGGQYYLYELPWYLIIGPPGSGKTTALLNSGLRFPLADRLGSQPIRGVSGTRNCEWLFTDEAVLIDTAGRYTTQESYQPVDAAEWRTFLDLLKRHRSRRPINGVLVTLSVSDLIQQTEEERALHAKAIRQRTQELYQILGVRFPVYMLFTKCDLVAGFTDFFADLTQEDRAQVWGETFPAEDPREPSDVITRFGSAYDELLQRLSRRTLKRIQEERDLQRRSLILDYPQQMALLKPAMLNFLEAVFAPTRYETRPLLRGVYFTSGTQEGTPIDRLMGILAAAFRFDRQAVPVYSGRGRSYFLTRLLKDVIFPEAELAGVDPRVERRQRLVQGAAYGSALCLTLGIIALWMLSYQRNHAALERVGEELRRFRAAELVTTDWASTLKTLRPKLDALLAAREAFKTAGWTAHWGLYQGRKLEQAAGHAYEQWLKGCFLPVNLRRLKQRMTEPEAANAEILHELLRVYLMLGQPERMDPKTAAPWIRTDWERQFATEPELVSRLSQHLDNLLHLSLDPVPIDEKFVAQVRKILADKPQPLLLYARFKHNALLDTAHDFKLGETLGPQGNRVFTASKGDLNNLTVPGLYTAWGFSELFLKQGLDFVKDNALQGWVMGGETAPDTTEIERLHRDFRNQYLADYQRAWKDLLSSISMRPMPTTLQAIQVLDALTRPDTPLRTLLEAVEQNTALTRIALRAAEAAAAAGAETKVATEDRTRRLLDTARQQTSSAQADALRAAEAEFEALNALVRGEGNRPPPLETILQTLANLHDYFLRIGSGGGPGPLDSASRSDAVLRAKVEFSRLPDPLKGWLLALTTQAAAQADKEAESQKKQAAQEAKAQKKKELNAMVKMGVATPCRAAIAGRYPFVRGSQKDVTLSDFAKLLAPSGILDRFFSDNLKPLVDVNRPHWAELAAGEEALGLASGSLRQFQNAAKIREAFFPAGGQSPAVAFDLKPISLDPKVAAFRLTLEGQETLYRHGPAQITRFQWPGPSAGTGVRIAFETLDGRHVSRSQEGAWALFRLLDETRIERTGVPDRFAVTFQAEGFAARYELQAASVNNPFELPELKNFDCPESL